MITPKRLNLRWMTAQHICSYKDDVCIALMLYILIKNVYICISLMLYIGEAVRIIMIGCRKGGVTKTTTTINLGFELSLKGKRVLIIDFDGQGDSTKYFRGGFDDDFYVGDALLDRKFDINHCIYPALVKGIPQENLYIIPARRGDVMTKLDMDMISLTKREERLKLHLNNIKNQFDIILIDTNPGTSVLGLNAVMAANEFLFPTEFKEHSLDGVETLLEHIQDVTFLDEDEIKFIVLPSKINKVAKKSLEYGRSYLQERWPLNTAKTTIYERSLFVEAELEHLPASILNKGHSASRYYKDLALEIIKNDR